jgi:hypothetical protein
MPIGGGEVDLFGVFLWVFLVALITAVAKKRGLDQWKWLVLGVLFAILALPAVFFVKAGDRDKSGSIRINVLVAVASVLGMVGVIYWPNIAPVFIGYNCETLIQSVKDISEENPLKVIAIFDQVETSQTSDHVECRGTALWSTGAKGPLTYKAFVDHGQWFISYQSQ